MASRHTGERIAQIAGAAVPDVLVFVEPEIAAPDDDRDARKLIVDLLETFIHSDEAQNDLLELLTLHLLAVLVSTMGPPM